MGKRKKNFRLTPVTAAKEKMNSRKHVRDDDGLLDPSARDFIYDEVDDFNDDAGIIDSTNDFIIDRESKEEQVLDIGGLSSDDDDEDDTLSNSSLSASAMDDNPLADIVDDNEERVLDERMLGRRKSDFYGTDIPDERIHNEARRYRKGETLSLIEKSAKDLQLRMAAQLKGLSSSYLLPQAEPVGHSKTSSLEEVDYGKLSSKKTEKLLRKSSPEFLETVESLKETCEELQTVLCPLIEAKKEGLLPEDLPCLEYLQTSYYLCLNYITLVSSYLMIRSSESYCTSHPVISRMSQYAHLFKELGHCKKVFTPQLLSLLEDLKSGRLSRSRKSSSKTKMLKILLKPNTEKEDKPFGISGNNLDEEKGCSSSADEDEAKIAKNDSIVEEGNPNEVPLGDRRAITYQIAKNKGLLPSRKKEQRNPRVKYRKKYKDKLKRRKGQVREVRKELNRYIGEMSGIKANTIKSIKLK